MFNLSTKQLDSYSILIASKYFKEAIDFINLMQVCHKFEETTEKLRYNPIPVTSKKLFPKMQTQYLYSVNDQRLDDVNRFEVWYTVEYDTYLQFKKENVKCHHVQYSNKNKREFGNELPTDINMLGVTCLKQSNIETITIPSYLTSFGSKCLESCTNLKNVVLSNGLTKLSDRCFINCRALISITIPTTLQIIESHCFENCASLQTVIIPDFVTEIGNNCFCGCTSLQSITLPSQLIGLEDKTFVFCESLTKIELPETLIVIGYSCFSKCTNLTAITIPTTVRLLGEKCFQYCNLQEIEIPESVKSIGLNCFAGCTSLTNLKFLSSVNEFTFNVSYHDSILYKQYGINCTNIVLTRYDITTQINLMRQNVVVPRHDIATQINLMRQTGDQQIEEFIVPNGITELDDFAFSFMRDIKSVKIPTTVTSIGVNCFSYCMKLTSLSIPNSVKSIGVFGFIRCTSLKQLSLPLNKNNKYPFKVLYSDYLVINKCGIDCEQIVFDLEDYHENGRAIPKDIPLILDIKTKTRQDEITNNIISLKRNHLTTRITSITIPTSVSKLCNKCFKDYIELQSITIPTTIKSIGKHLIDGCIKLTQLNYEGNWNDIVVSYDDHLRYKTKGLLLNNFEYTNDDKIKYGNVIPSIVHSLHNTYHDKSFGMLHIPTHITSLDNKMYSSTWNEETECYSYSNFTSIVIPTSIQSIPKQCFSSCYLLQNISLPTTLTTIQKKAFSNCISLQSINIPTTITLIEKHAFNGCYSLTSITLPTTVTLQEYCFKGCTQLKSILNIPNHCF